jgi:hypothetical protein
MKKVSVLLLSVLLLSATAYTAPTSLNSTAFAYYTNGINASTFIRFERDRIKRRTPELRRKVNLRNGHRMNQITTLNV